MKNLTWGVPAPRPFRIRQNSKNELGAICLIIIDSSKIVANFVVKELKKHNLVSNKRTAKYQFYVSNYTESFEKSANFFFKEKIKLEEVNLFSNQ